MSTSQHTAEVVIKGKTDGVTAKLKDVADGTEKVKRAADAAGTSQEDWGRKLDAMDKRMSGFAGTVSKVSSVLGAAGLVGMLAGAGAALEDMAARAQQLTTAQAALKISIDGARAATMGLVGDYDLTIAANKAVQLGVVKSSADFARLTATASKLGMAMGQDAAKSVDDLTTALGRGSTEILDNLGIQLKVSEANEVYAAKLGKTAAALTDVERKQAFMVVGLERAEEAAAKSGVSLDTHATKIQQLATDYANLKDNLVLFTTTALVAWEHKIETATGYMEGWVNALTGAEDPTKTATTSTADLRDEIHQTASVLGIAAKEADAWTAALFGLDNANRVESGKAREDQARSAWMDYRKQNDELRKTVALEDARDAQSRKAMQRANAKGRGKGGKPEADVVALDRFADANMTGMESTRDITDSIQIEANNEAMGREMQLRQDRIALIEHEREVVGAYVDAGMMSADAEESVQARKYQAEKDLLDFQISAANTRAEIIDLETAKRQKALAEQQRHMSRSQTIEIKSLQTKQAQYQQYGGAVAGVIGQVTMAAIDGANGQDHAAARVIAAVGKQVRNQLIMTAIQEGVLAIASAASFNYLGAAQHGVAAGVAAAGAITVGSIAGIAGAQIPPPPATGGGGGGASESAGDGGSGPKMGKNKGGGDDDGVPTSYYDGGLYSKRPDRTPQAANGSGSTTNNITVLGATTEQVGLALMRIQETTRRSMGKVQ